MFGELVEVGSIVCDVGEGCLINDQVANVQESEARHGLQPPEFITAAYKSKQGFTR